MQPQKKVLFTTAYIRDRNACYNWMATNVTWKSKLHAERSISAGLRFIKQNIPEIEILEYGNLGPEACGNRR